MVAQVDGTTAPWEGEIEVHDDVYLAVLERTAGALRGASILHLFMGGVASGALGRPRWTHDIDVFIRKQDVEHALTALADAGFLTREQNPQWLAKAVLDDVLVDLVFRSAGAITLDQEMVEHARTVVFQGITLPVLGPEDLIVIKAAVAKEHAPRHWHDALALLRRDDLDWDYLVRRGSTLSPERLRSLLWYARSCDQAIPDRALEAMNGGAE
jgi:predicted nucleotidyltransferase